MTVKAIYDGHHGEVVDAVVNFNGNILLYVLWDGDLLYGAPGTLQVSPNTPFGEFRDDALSPAYAGHPHWPRVDWQRVSWNLDGKDIAPLNHESLAALGAGHKSMLRFRTPETPTLTA
ncbi:MAG: phenol hydroxylase subunit P4 [Gammaproteobacteria bacterium]|nr:phenol hydroxylase subunit P4 [Gammaproteobacteria bacterium]